VLFGFGACLVSENAMIRPTFVFDLARRERLPMPVALRARVLARETEQNGVQTTPDELADLIEATFDHLFRLWVAEFAHAGAPDEGMARQVVSRLGGKLLLGQRVGFARELREVFVKQQRPTVVEGLVRVDFGRHGDREHRVARLVEFRNSFAHGAFGATVSAIEEHRALLESVLEDLPSLVEQPVMARTEAQELVELRGALEPVPAATVEPASPLAPYIVGRDGSTRLDLFPIWRMGRGHGGEWSLLPPDPAVTAHSVDEFFAREALRGYAQRWADERDGVFDHSAKVRERAWRTLASEEVAALRKAVSEVQLVLVEGHPGCGKAAALAALLDGSAVESGRFADVAAVVLEAGEPAQSAATFAAFVARSVERALGLGVRKLFEGPGAPSPKKLRELSASGLARAAAERLAHAGKRVLILVEDAHEGTRPGWGQKETVANVVRALAGTNVHVIATIHPGALALPFAHDRKITLSDMTSPRTDRLGTFLEASLRGRALHRRAVEVLATRGEPTTLFALCDELDVAGGEPVFEPAVERALADLRPLLKSRRAGSGAEREWQLFHPAVAEALRQLGGAS
jgi:hypothetical protein